MKKELQRFIEILEENGEYYFSQGGIKKDYQYIKSILKAQGYYSGCKYRFYFNDKMELEKIEERVFGC